MAGFKLNEINLEEFKNLDPNNFGSWPIVVKAAVVLVVFIAALAAAYYFHVQDQLQRLVTEERKEQELREDFRKKQWEAATLPRLQEQLREVESNLTELQNRLPNKAQVAGLIQDISQQAIASGLSSELFKPGREETGQVYIKLPITLKLRGNYHAFGNFISGLAAMPRIVTQHDISITSSSAKSADDDSALTLEMTAQIYRYLDDSEEPTEESK